MKPSEFLTAILPSDGHVAIVGIKNKKVQQVLVNDVAAAKDVIGAALSNGEDVYFGCAAFATKESRKAENVLHLKSFWIDLDCGEGTAYATQQDGWTALAALCEATHLPAPFVVNSGGGLHVYWALETPLLVDVWSIYACRLVELCAAAGLSIKDPGCSTDPARILRVPGTFNYKNPEEPRKVQQLCLGAVTPWLELKSIIETACGERNINGFEPKKQKKKPAKALDPVTAALAGNQISSFAKILKSRACAQINFAADNPADVPEPLWRAVLSVAQVCEDRDASIHAISQGDPRYDAQETEDKASNTGGPYTCDAFAKCDAARCETCSLRGKIVGPIALGRDIARAAEPAEPEEIKLSIPTTAIKVPKLPHPYFRGAHGGIYIAGPAGPDGESGEPELIYEHDLNIVRRIKDPEKGEVLIILHNRPKDGMEEIVIPLADALSLERMKDKLGYHGVAAHKDRMNKIGTYLISAVRGMQHDAAAEPARSQMGWTDERDGIVWGRTMFTKDGQHYCPPAAKSTTVANMMRTSGTLEAWESIAERYAEPGFELYACCLLMAFGSMLNHYTYEDPVWVHMVSSESGTGKTTLTNVINSIWGDPVAMKLTVMDTVNALEKRRVVFNSMAICQDEITNLPPEKLSQLAYAQSQGREKLRLGAGSQEMVNHDRRNNTFFTNGNRHISDVLGTFKTNAAGEFARLVEIPFNTLTRVVSGEDHFGKIIKNYGHAGPMLAKWLVAHESELDDRVLRERVRFETEFASVSSERNWVGLTAAGFAAARILQEELGLLKKYNLPHLYTSWVAHMRTIRQSISGNVVTHEQVLGDFINDNYSNILIPDSHAAKITDETTASLYGRKTERESRNKLVIRWEKDTRKLFVSHSELRAYCTRRAHSFVDLLAFYEKNIQFTGVVTKRMGVGTGVMTSPVKCLSFSVDDELGSILKGE